jgi:hypothetical protein
MSPELIVGGYSDAPIIVARARWKPLNLVQLPSSRSVTILDNNPHTGETKYDATVTKIPAMACSTMDAEWLSNLLRSNNNLQTKKVQLFMKMNCRHYRMRQL